MPSVPRPTGRRTDARAPKCTPGGLRRQSVRPQVPGSQTPTCLCENRRYGGSLRILTGSWTSVQRKVFHFKWWALQAAEKLCTGQEKRTSGAKAQTASRSATGVADSHALDGHAYSTKDDSTNIETSGGGTPGKPTAAHAGSVIGLPGVTSHRNDLGLAVALRVVALQERIVEIHYTHPALGLNINNNSIVWLSTRADFSMISVLQTLFLASCRNKETRQED
jgi:hypothetical protein